MAPSFVCDPGHTRDRISHREVLCGPPAMATGARDASRGFDNGIAISHFNGRDKYEKEDISSGEIFL